MNPRHHSKEKRRPWPWVLCSLLLALAWLQVGVAHVPASVCSMIPAFIASWSRPFGMLLLTGWPPRTPPASNCQQPRPATVTSVLLGQQRCRCTASHQQLQQHSNRLWTGSRSRVARRLCWRAAELLSSPPASAGAAVAANASADKRRACRP